LKIKIEVIIKHSKSSLEEKIKSVKKTSSYTKLTTNISEKPKFIKINLPYPSKFNPIRGLNKLNHKNCHITIKK